MSAQTQPQKQVYRVAQWATGRIGRSGLEAIAKHSRLELVGVYVHSQDKHGRDAGELCDLDPIGVSATSNLDDIIALRPDCVVAAQQGACIDDACRMLEAGINIVTTQVDYLNPAKMVPELRQRAEEASRKGGASIHSTGISPGFSSEALPLVLTSFARRVDCLTIDEFADMPASVPDEQLLDRGLRFGREAGEDFDPNLLDHIAHGFAQSIDLVATALDLPLDDIQRTGEVATARSRVTLPGGGVIEKGTVSAQRITVAGMRDGREFLRFRVNWYCSTDVDPAWDLRGNGWRVLMEGSTPVDLSVSFPVPKEGYSAAMAGLTAYRAVNAVPYVCDAAPGIRTSVDLPQIIAKLG